MRSIFNLPARWALLLSLCSGPVLAQGPLVPPGPPAPTMKTLEQIEPRIPIRPTDLPLTINKSGSYYLTGDIRYLTPNQDAIVISTSSVSIDLMGFTLIGPGRDTGSQGTAIKVVGTRRNCIVRNGTIKNWRGDGLALFVDMNNYISNATVQGVSADFNGGRGIAVYASTVSNCWASANDYGIYAHGYSTLRSNDATSNKFDGIRVGTYCMVRDNTSMNNGSRQVLGGSRGNGAGIRAMGTGNNLDGNSVFANDRGIQADAGSNLIIRNAATANTDAYGSIHAGSTVGPVVTSGTITTNNSPHANFRY